MNKAEMFTRRSTDSTSLIIKPMCLHSYRVTPKSVKQLCLMQTQLILQRMQIRLMKTNGVRSHLNGVNFVLLKHLKTNYCSYCVINEAIKNENSL